MKTPVTLVTIMKRPLILTFIRLAYLHQQLSRRTRRVMALPMRRVPDLQVPRMNLIILPFPSRNLLTAGLRQVLTLIIIRS